MEKKLLELSSSFAEQLEITIIVLIIAIIICLITLIVIIRSLRKNQKGRSIATIMVFAVSFIILVSLFVEVFGIIKIRYNLKRDAQEMITNSAEGMVESVIYKLKLPYIVIDSDKYWYLNEELGTTINRGENYTIKYFIHSRYIFEVQKLE